MSKIGTQYEEGYEEGFAAGRWDILRQFPYAVEQVKGEPVWALFRDEDDAFAYADGFFAGRAIDSSKRFGD